MTAHFFDDVHEYLDGFNYIRPAVPGVPDSCTVCRGGLPKGKSYTTCIKCKHISSIFPPVFDALGFGVFVLGGEQDATDFASYKQDYPPERAIGIVTSIAYLGLLQAISKSPDISTVATVPSLSGRVGMHPLSGVVGKALAKIEGAPPLRRLLSGKDVDYDSRRDVNREHFDCIEAPPDHVLLVDDMWTGGGHLVSAALRLRESGAKKITAIALSRRLSAGTTFTGGDIYNSREVKIRLRHHDWFGLNGNKLF